MIIQSIQAEDFRKYSVLHINDIPARGLIMVAGGNESGKSSIGDAISFALFGFTDRVPKESAAKLVRWGSDKAQVKLVLNVRGRLFQLSRAVTADGHELASLWDVDHGVTLADTPEQVQELLRDLLGYGYKAFSRTFYWSQQAGEEGMADAESIQAMAGLQLYQQLQSVMAEECGITQKRAEALEAEYKQGEQQVNLLEFDQARLPWLNDVHTELNTLQRQHLLATQDLTKESERYGANYGSFQALKKQISRMNGWAMLGVVLMLALLVLALLSILKPDLIGTSLAQYQNLIIGGAMAFALLSGGMLFYSFLLESRQLRPLYDQSSIFLQRLLSGQHLMNLSLRDLLHPASVDWLNSKQYAEPEKPDALAVNTLRDRLNRVEGYSLNPTDSASLTSNLYSGLEQRQQSLLDLSTQAQRDIQVEEQRSNEYEQVYATFKQRTATWQEADQLLRVQFTAQGLLERSTQYLARRFNHVVSQRCQKLLQAFTQGRYQTIEMSDDLGLRVLSNEKGGYLEFNEISAGTQRQIALAMRIALAKALAESSDLQEQFLFLDEPFVFFDNERTYATLHSLIKATHEALSQIWITAQMLPDGINPALVVPCYKEQSRLVMQGGSVVESVATTNATPLGTQIAAVAEAD